MVSLFPYTTSNVVTWWKHREHLDLIHVSVCCISYLLIQLPLGLIHLFVYIVNSTNIIGGLIVNQQTSS
jgi:hypothetical protein